MRTIGIATLLAAALVLAAATSIAQAASPAEPDPAAAVTSEAAVAENAGPAEEPGERRGYGRQRRARESGCCGRCGGGGGHGQGKAGQPGSRCQGRGPDLSAVTTTTGTVMAYDGGPGQKMPTVTVAVEDEWLEIFVGPNRVWRDAAFRPTVGQDLEVTYAPASSDSHLVAISVTDPASGLSVTLRDPETGFPAGKQGGRRGGRGSCGRG